MRVKSCRCFRREPIAAKISVERLGRNECHRLRETAHSSALQMRGKRTLDGELISLGERCHFALIPPDLHGNITSRGSRMYVRRIRGAIVADLRDDLSGFDSVS